MKTKKFVRIASVMLVLIFTMSAFVSANAATYFEENGFKYSPISKFNCRIY